MSAPAVAHRYTWEEDGPLGLKLMHCGKNPDDKQGVQVSGFEDNFPGDPTESGIQKGMKLLSVNGTDVAFHSKTDTIAAVRAASRPLTMEFSKKKKLVNGLKAAAQRKMAALAREHELEAFQKVSPPCTSALFL